MELDGPRGGEGPIQTEGEGRFYEAKEVPRLSERENEIKKKRRRRRRRRRGAGEEN